MENLTLCLLLVPGVLVPDLSPTKRMLRALKFLKLKLKGKSFIITWKLEQKVDGIIPQGEFVDSYSVKTCLHWNWDPQVRVFIFITWYKGEPAWTHALEGPHGPNWSTKWPNCLISYIELNPSIMFWKLF